MYDKFIDIISRTALILASAFMAVMMIVTVVDVFMRYVFSAPLPSVAETTQILLSLTVFAGFVLVSRDGSHIVVSLFEPQMMRIAPRLYRGLYAVSNILGCAFVTYFLFLSAVDAWEFEEVTAALEIPMIWILGVLIFLSTLALIASSAVFWRGPSGHGSVD